MVEDMEEGMVCKMVEGMEEGMACIVEDIVEDMVEGMGCMPVVGMVCMVEDMEVGKQVRIVYHRILEPHLCHSIGWKNNRFLLVP